MGISGYGFRTDGLSGGHRDRKDREERENLEGGGSIKGGSDICIEYLRSTGCGIIHFHLPL